VKNRRFIPVAIALVAVIAVSGVAYAYWTAGGTGTGSANAADSVSTLTAKGPASLTSMFPGDAAQTISGTFDNPNAAATWVTSVTVSITVTKAGGAPSGNCDATDFDLVNPVATVNALIPTGSGQGAWGNLATHPTIQFHNKASNQDACKGATVDLTYTIL
jgi:hypothetical protein